MSRVHTRMPDHRATEDNENIYKHVNRQYESSFILPELACSISTEQLKIPSIDYAELQTTKVHYATEICKMFIQGDLHTTEVEQYKQGQINRYVTSTEKTSSF